MRNKKFLLSIFLLFVYQIFIVNSTIANGRDIIPVSGLEKGTIIKPYQEEMTQVGFEYEFLVDPTTIMQTYLDSLPAGATKYPIKRQLENGTGTYISFLGNQSLAEIPKQHAAYFDENGNLIDLNTFPSNNSYHGSGDIILHQTSGNCIASWSETESGGSGECTICFDNFAAQMAPGNWSSISNLNSVASDEYSSPRLYTGQSPLGYDWIRIYHISQNITPNAEGHVCNDVRIMYIDVENTETVDLTQLLNSGNWNSVYPMQQWREKSCALKTVNFLIDEDYWYNDGCVGFMGFTQWLEGDLGNMPANPGVFFWVSEDYGETWDYANLNCQSQDTSEVLYQVENIPEFEFDGVVPDYLDVEFMGLNNSAYLWDGDYVMNFVKRYTYTDPQSNQKYYLEYFTPQAEVFWTSYDEEFKFNSVPDLPGIDSYSGQSVPWKVEDNDTTLYVVVTSSQDYPSLQRSAIDYSYFSFPRIQIWTDFTYHTLAELGYTQYSEYFERPVINFAYAYYKTIKVSSWWNVLVELTDINNPMFDFSDQTTVFPYVDNFINYTGGLKDSWEGWYQIYLYYYDDNSFGARQNQTNGGSLKYTVLRFKVRQFGVEPEVGSNINCINYPNPFSNQTEISFSTDIPFQNTSVKIYNTKGQLIKKLNTDNEITNDNQSVIWKGKDMNGDTVSNGMYFYKISFDSATYCGKLLLMR